MRIRSIDHKPGENYVSPGIRFPTRLRYTEFEEAVMGVSGWLETADGKIIASLEEEHAEAIVHSEIGARGSSFDSQFKTSDYETVLAASLDSRALDHIEKMRVKDEKRDVHFTLDLIVRSIDSRALVSHVHVVNQTDLGMRVTTEIYTGSRSTKDYQFLVYARDSGFSADQNNRWLISGNDRPVFLTTTRQTLKKAVTIRSSDWIHDYAPVLHLGEYFVIEIPKGQRTIEKAWKYIESAEESFRGWRIKEVYANCREVGSLLDKTIKQRFKKGSYDYDDRWGGAYGRFEHLTSLGLHVEDLEEKHGAGEVDIGRVDAEHLLIVTKALIKYAEELLHGSGD